MEDFLEKIVRGKKEELKKFKIEHPLNEMKRHLSPSVRNFDSAIKKPGKISIIAELKKASPSGGVLRENFEPVKLAKCFEKAGASAISVLTEEKYFKGRLEYIRKIKESVTLPVLRKDFIIDEYQIYQSASYGADAILLITAILSKKELAYFIGLAKKLSLSALVEVHNKEELQNAISSGAEIIGINNRNLKTLKVDLSVTFDLRKSVPEDKTLVSESGIKTADDVMRLKNIGVHAILVGETLMKNPAPSAKLKELLKGA